MKLPYVLGGATILCAVVGSYFLTQLSGYEQISKSKLGVMKAGQEYVRLQSDHPGYDWRVRIRFYGKVLDQFDQPVAGATVWLQWVNLRGPEGVGETGLTTDNLGTFSLGRTKGKHLSVRVKKAGYYDLSGKDNQTDFEYADPFQSTFYEPDPDKPFVFRMRKIGAGAALVKRSLELRPPRSGNAMCVDLLSGKESADGQLLIKTWKPEITSDQTRTGEVFPYEWRVTLQLTNGGFVEQHDIFPFDAPKDGYLPLIDVSQRAVNGASGVSVRKSYYFCFDQPPKYGRLNVSTDGDRPYFWIEYYLNPVGSRNLEPTAMMRDDAEH